MTSAAQVQLKRAQEGESDEKKRTQLVKKSIHSSFQALNWNG